MSLSDGFWDRLPFHDNFRYEAVCYYGNSEIGHWVSIDRVVLMWRVWTHKGVYVHVTVSWINYGIRGASNDVIVQPKFTCRRVFLKNVFSSFFLNVLVHNIILLNILVQNRRPYVLERDVAEPWLQSETTEIQVKFAGKPTALRIKVNLFNIIGQT